MSIRKSFEAAAAWWTARINEDRREPLSEKQRTIFESRLVAELFRHVAMFSPYPAWIIVEFTTPMLLRRCADAAGIPVVDGCTFPPNIRMEFSSDGTVRVSRDRDRLTVIATPDEAPVE